MPSLPGAEFTGCRIHYSRCRVHQVPGLPGAGLTSIPLIVRNQARVKFIIQHCFIVPCLTYNIIYFFPDNHWLNKNYRCTLMNDVFSFSGSCSPLPNHVTYSWLFFVRDSVEIFVLFWHALKSINKKNRKANNFYFEWSVHFIEPDNWWKKE